MLQPLLTGGTHTGSLLACRQTRKWTVRVDSYAELKKINSVDIIPDLPLRDRRPGNPTESMFT
ncbi:hypothetical protein J6590_083961 [Homalodisca vitripennis]|nr:hypothetical protein J6590_083961 [Homalodisca vitripennis]